jgi:hypothetical protein
VNDGGWLEPARLLDLPFHQMSEIKKMMKSFISLLDWSIAPSAEQD